MHNLIITLFPQINSDIFGDSSVDWNLALSNSHTYSLIIKMSEDIKNNVPQIAITSYTSNDEDAEVTNLFNSTKEFNDIKIHEPRSVTPKLSRHKSRIVLKSPVPKNVSKSLTPGMLDMNCITDVEDMSDSDDEKCYIRTSNLTPGPINYFILTDVEDLSEDEEHENKYEVEEELTDTENFTDDKEIFNEIEQTKQSFESVSYFPQPHQEILFHSKDGTVRSQSPTDEPYPIWLKTPNEEVKGFESEEETITVEECGGMDSHLKNNNIYYHDINVGIVESVESVKNEKYKQKYRHRAPSIKKIVTSEIECNKKRFRNKTRRNSETEENIDKRSEENKKKTLSKYMSEPILSKMGIPPQNKNNETNKIKHQENNNSFVIHDNRNGFSLSIDFESHNTVLLNVCRDYGNLTMKWFNNGIATGRVISEYSNQNILEPLEPGYFIKSSLYDSKRQIDVDLFTYGTMKTLQNNYFTYIAVYNVVQPVNIVQLYINRPYLTQIAIVKNPLVKLNSLKDKFTSMERLYPSPVTRLSAFKIFNQNESDKYTEPKKIKFESEKHVSDVINIFESMCGSPKLRRKFNSNKLPCSGYNLKKSDINRNINCLYKGKKTQIGKYKLNYYQVIKLVME